MKKALLVLSLAFICITVKAQESKVTTFHRMLILNKENKLLVVKIKNKDIWVTPGLYQNSKQTINQGIDSIASTYGIKVFDIKLRGMYGLKTRSKNHYSTRNIFVMKTDAIDVLLPEIIEEVLWLDINEAVKRISFSHISDFINDVFMFPNAIRYGTMERGDNHGNYESKISERFYSSKKD
ncbi:hypothetical protein [Lacinutrix cladophorae]